MHDQADHRARLVSSVAATVISLACGTNYVYSAWAPQFADKLKLSATQSNLIGLAGNLGMYSMGVPIGMFIDSRGPRPAVIAGSILLALGYFPLRQAFVRGSGSVVFLCLVSYLTGLGGCMAFAAAVKTSALNWPHHRGTATAFPLAAFGLSAFFFALFGSLIVPGDTSAFLLLLAIGTFVLTFVSFFFLHVLPPATGHSHYHAVGATDDDALSDSQQLRRTISEEAKLARRGGGGGRGRAYQQTEEPGRSLDDDNDDHAHGSYGAYEDQADRGTEGAGTRGQDEGEDARKGVDDNDGDLSSPQAPRSTAMTYASISHENGSSSSASASASASASTSASASNPFAAPLAAEDADQDPMDETSSLVSKASSLPGEILLQNSVDMDQSHRVDIRGWNLLRNVEFWQFFAIMGILAGIGLMTIK
ncbi:MFS transporter [Sporothrix schenckii 1099-18]|uniref:MFS transporter n=1 Tax=Sporothrix schenckii 1099-18 TaxID=1397361 RepID=A0A0F2M4T8_SPOSC|nr:MFS transporter [Sporothrix schenckii 1099-18]KJR84718.1 MFS transporter [Sporothrix schenckii 1099-18]